MGSLGVVRVVEIYHAQRYQGGLLLDQKDLDGYFQLCYEEKYKESRLIQTYFPLYIMRSSSATINILLNMALVLSVVVVVQKVEGGVP